MAGLFSKPKEPTVRPPAPMPDDNDPAILAADRRRRASMIGRGGRASTILSESGPGRNDEFRSLKLG